jgi:DNA-binding response OmpR family regulator
MRVLVVEDERKVADALRDGLQAEHHDVVVERTGGDGLRRAMTEPFDVIVLDLGLPDGDGLHLLAEIRQHVMRVPVIVLTARDTIADRVAGLDAGADDYIVKPFAFAELLARIRAVARRGSPGDSYQFAVGSLKMDLTARRVTRDREPVELTVREFELLAYLMRHEGQVVSREALARDVWKEQARSTPLDNVIDVHITRLRRKVDNDESAKLIHTIRGVGFMMRSGEP